MNTPASSQAYFTLAELESASCPAGLRMFVSNWLIWKRGGDSGKTDMELNNQDGRHRIASKMESMAIETPGVELLLDGALPKPGEDEQALNEFRAMHGIPDRVH